MLLRSTPFPEELLRMAAVGHPCVSFCQKRNTSFKTSICMGGTMSSIHQCCIFRKRQAWAYNPLSVAGLSSTHFLMEAPFHGVTVVCVTKHPHLGQLQHLLLSPVLPSSSEANCLETAEFKAGAVPEISSHPVTRFLHASALSSFVCLLKIKS